MAMLIKVGPVSSQCRYLMPVIQPGGRIIRETYCFLPRGHDGPHRNLEGAVIVNADDIRRAMNGDLADPKWRSR